MEQQQTSFIPKKSLAKDTTTYEAPVGIFMLLATFVFFLAVFAEGGVYFYNLLLRRDIDAMSESLDRAQKSFEPSLIVELERLDRRIESAKEILTNHVVVTPLFQLLENSTIPNVRFNKFTYSFIEPGRIELTMGGQARSYAYVAVQSDILSGSKYVNDHIFSNLNLDAQGNVTFDLFATLDPSLVLYRDAIEREGLSTE